MNTTTEINLETLLPWSEAKLTPTVNGDRLLCRAEPNEEFWKLWSVNREQLRAAGIGVSVWPKGSNKWQVAWWKPLPTEVLEARRESMEMSRATDADIEIPAPDGYSYLGYQKAGIKFMMKRFCDLKK